MGIRFETIPSNLCENSHFGLSPKSMARRLSQLKALKVFSFRKNSAVLAGDTLLELNGEVLGKPKNKSDAENMLKCLSGNVHKVHTGITVVTNQYTNTLVETTLVEFRALNSEDITNYIKTGKTSDKSGGYGIQDTELMPVIRISGSYWNVVGLPVVAASILLNNANVIPDSALINYKTLDGMK